MGEAKRKAEARESDAAFQMAKRADEALTLILETLMQEEGADPRHIGGGLAMAFARFTIEHLTEPPEVPTVHGVNSVCFRAINYAASALLVKPTGEAS